MGKEVIDCSEWTLEETSNDTEHGTQVNGNNSTNGPLLENLPSNRRVPLPLELNCQIFECLKFGTQRKFIGGLGRGIYGMFREKVLTKSKRLQNPKQNGWKLSKSSIGLLARDRGNWQNVYAWKGFPIAVALSRTDNFPGTILYYFEVTIISSEHRQTLVGLSSENIIGDSLTSRVTNSYAMRDRNDLCWLSGKSHPFEWSNCALKPEWNGIGDVFGCGVSLNPVNELSIFFTGNGILMGKQISIKRSNIVALTLMIDEHPLETWVDVYGLVPRSQLIRLMPNLEEQPTTIGDRQFVSLVQFFLHKCGQITLGELSTSNDGSPTICKIINFNKTKCKLPLPLTDVPMPENITNFKEIWLRSTDNSVIRFLQEFQRNSLLTNANLDFRFRAMSPEPNSFPQFMANFWPLFTTINFVRIEGGALDCIQCEHFDLAKPMMASARILYSLYNCRDCWFCEWLQTPREDGMPRILVLYSPGYDYSHLHFIRHIKKDFMEARQPISFFIHLKHFRDTGAVQSFSLDNLKTNEKLVVKGSTRRSRMTILRYEAAEEWIEEMAKYETKKQYRTIQICL